MAMPIHDFLHDITAESIPAEVLCLGRRWLLDLLGVAVGGTSTSMSQIARSHVIRHFGPGQKPARVLFDGRLASPAGAALAGGMTIDALDAHDGHKLTKGHVGCGVLPALMAMSEAEGELDDRAFLTGLVIGYEIGTRAGIALHRTVSDYHTSGAWVALAAAALGARVLRLDTARTREALGIAEYHGPRSQMMRCIDAPTMVKDGSGWGSMAGVSAAYLAADGFTGAPALTVEAPDVSDLWSDLGSKWRISEQYFKPFPICRWAQPALHAVLTLRARHDLNSDMVEAVNLTTFHESKRLAVRSPETTEQAQYSTAFPVAVGLVHGTVEPEHVSEASFADPEIRRLAEGMTITESTEFNSAFPSRRFSSVELRLKDGRVLYSGPTEAPGDPEVPVSTAQIRAKFHRYADARLGAERASAIDQAVEKLGDGSGAELLFELATTAAIEGVPPAGPTTPWR
ncbi:MmgE/PrpD family protein [Mesorhizobium plurifarium]|uniref:MmgE/PrpD family protein n=1 Tax=Mesorhizobium plurifarium TaxID=69974 RepID=A0A090EP14_MESPL|nr:MmgE/PrpD family protein [Mesorhizobium plurifarium]